MPVSKQTPVSSNEDLVRAGQPGVDLFCEDLAANTAHIKANLHRIFKRKSNIDFIESMLLFYEETGSYTRKQLPWITAAWHYVNEHAGPIPF